MSWDIILFNSRQRITSIEELDSAQLEPADFCSAFEDHFKNIVKNGEHREVRGKNFTIDYFTDDEDVSNKMVSLHGENGLYELVVLAIKHNWQIFDTGLGHMIDLEKPERNGYENFQRYLRQVAGGKEE